MRRTLFGALAALTALGVAMLVSAVATAAPSSITFGSPSPVEGATLTTDSVAFAFTYPKKPSATKTATCALVGPTASSGSCNAPVADGSKGAKSGKSYTGLANGSYTLTVSLVLSDGGEATATRHFTINVASADISISGSFFSSPNTHSITVTNSGPNAATVTVKLHCERADSLAVAGGNLDVFWQETTPIGTADPRTWVRTLQAGESISGMRVGCSYGGFNLPPEPVAGSFQVSASSVADPDSTPNNDVTTEDDYYALFLPT